MTNVVAIIGARSGSRGVPHKNIRPLAGHPLLAYSIRAAQEAGISEIVVSTDSIEYASIAKKYGARAVLRPDAISQDNSTDFQYIAHAISTFDPPADLIVHLRPTTVLRWPEIVSDAVDTMLLHPECTALRSVHEMSESAYKCFEIEGQALKCVGTGSLELDAANRPRQVFPKTYHANGYVDILRTTFMRENPGLIHGNAVLPFITPVVTEIDTEADLDYVRYQAERNQELVKRLFS